MKSRILNALRKQDGYVSGQELCREFEVSRTAIWKGINQLKEEGYVIEAVPRKGYRIVGYPDSVGKVELESRMETKWAGRQIVYLKTVNSTNNYAKKLAENGGVHGTLVVADAQTEGKGRRGRGWVTPKGAAIAMSLILRPQLIPSHASMLTLVAGMAVAVAIRGVTGLEAQIKWPNDVVINGKKLTGILTELSAEMDAINYVVTGIGINVNIKEMPLEVRDIATSLQIQLGKPLDRGAIICEVMKAFEEYYQKFMEAGDMYLLTEEYERILANKNKQVKVLEPGNEYTGIARGINSQGELLVEREDGTVAAVYAGEVSVRGIYQYV